MAYPSATAILGMALGGNAAPPTDQFGRRELSTHSVPRAARAARARAG